MSVPRAAGADTLEETVQWSAPPACPGVAEVRARVERLLGRPLERPGKAIRVSGEVARDPGEGPWRLRLAIAFGQGPAKERRLEGETCAQLTDAAAVVLALAVGAEPAPPAPAHGAPDAPIEDPEPAPAPRRVTWDLAALGGIDVAALPGPAAGIGIGAGVDLGPDRIALRAAGWLPRAAALAGGTAVGGSFSLVAADLRYCRWLVGRTVDVAPCAGVEGGVILASATGAARPLTGVGRWLAPQIGLLGMVRPSPRFAVSLALDGLVPVFRDAFTVAGAGVVYQTSPATFRATLGAHLRFP